MITILYISTTFKFVLKECPYQPDQLIQVKSFISVFLSNLITFEYCTFLGQNILCRKSSWVTLCLQSSD